MESAGFGIIIRVNDLDACRYFYSRVLGLGEPVFDSPFAAGFRAGCGIMLCLQKTSAPYLTHGCNPVSLLITSSSAAEFESLRQRLTEAGLAPDAEPEIAGAGRFFRGRDPEGNIFLIDPADFPD